MSYPTLQIVNANTRSHYDPNEVSRLASIWEDYIEQPCLAIMQRDIKYWLEQGFEPCVIEMAIEQTAYAPRPAWRYLQSIMARSRADEAFTGEAFLRRPKRAKSALPL